MTSIAFDFASVGVNASIATRSLVPANSKVVYTLCCIKARPLVGTVASLHARNSCFRQTVLVHSLTSWAEDLSGTNTATGGLGSTTSGALDIVTSATSHSTGRTIKGRNRKHGNSTPPSQRASSALDYTQILKHPIVTEAGIKNILNNNTLVFAVDKRADKTVIKDAAKKIFKIQIKKVNTSITPDGTKKAFLMLTPECSAADVAKIVKAI